MTVKHGDTEAFINLTFCQKALGGASPDGQTSELPHLQQLLSTVLCILGGLYWTVCPSVHRGLEWNRVSVDLDIL